MYRFAENARNELWDALIADDSHWFNVGVWIYNGTKTSDTHTTYREDKILEMSTSYRMFSEEQPSVGGCLAGELTLKLLDPAPVSRMAAIIPYVQATNGTDTSAWMPQGYFWVDTRETTNNDDGLPILTLHAYDAMLKAEADFPNTTQSYPRSDINVVKEIAKAMGLQSNITGTNGIDSRTVSLMNKGYQIGLPVGYSMREVLSYIASMYASNWIMSYDRKLLLIPINGIPAETKHLVDNAGIPISFGGDTILV